MTSDLDARIRERLAAPDADDEPDDWGDHWADFDAARRALLAVLEVHKRVHVSGYSGAKGWDNCASCRNTNWGGPEVDWPCEAVEAIATELGIEPADG